MNLLTTEFSRVSCDIIL